MPPLRARFQDWKRSAARPTSATGWTIPLSIATMAGRPDHPCPTVPAQLPNFVCRWSKTGTVSAAHSLRIESD